MKSNQYALLVIFLIGLINGAAQEVPLDWQHYNTENTNIKGISTLEAYELLKGKTPNTIIVAVIDSGVDIYHEDLDDVIWTNEDEIPNNNIDDDNNGYVDDIHGWSFLCSSAGENVDGEALEETRIFANAKNYAGDKNTLINAVTAYAEGRERVLRNYFRSQLEYQGVLEIENDFGGKEIDLKAMENYSVREDLKNSKNLIINYLKAIKNGSLTVLNESLNQRIEYYKSQLDSYYNPKLDGRQVVKDNYAKQKERYYGCNDVLGPDPHHGTHVAGIIAAERGNNQGMDGVANTVRIMPVRVVPNGDERDKDVANAIRYAVDNGAKVVNMSFGKSFSWNKKVVDEAIKYAQKKDVLLVHSAGNDAKEVTVTNNFPNKVFEKSGLFSSKKAKNMIEVGATTNTYNEQFVAYFSNFSKEQIDIFAPGYQIYSTTPNNNYSRYNGTSMATPLVSGVAALIRSHFPKLSAQEVKDIILNSATKINLDVSRPSNDKIVPFNSLSKTGGILNAAEAIKLALKN